MVWLSKRWPFVYFYPKVFISYSSTDDKLVKNIAEFSRITNQNVWRDNDDLEYGERWWSAIQQAIKSCHIVFVFWCDHSRQSLYVRREIDCAIKHKKKIVPIVLDEVDLDRRLKALHVIDMRETFKHNSKSIDHNTVQKVAYLAKEQIKKTETVGNMPIAVGSVLIVVGMLTFNIVPYHPETGAPPNDQKDLARYEQALDIMRDFAVDFCENSPLAGSGGEVELSTNARISLDGLIAKLAALGVEGAGEYSTEGYNGLLQRDLSTIVAHSEDCRSQIRRELQGKFIEAPASRPVTPHPEHP